MAPTRISLLLHNLKSFKSDIRLRYLKMKGLRVAKGKLFIGKITCEWPNSLIIGSKCNIEDGVDFKIVHPYSNDNYIQLGDNVFIGRACEFHCKSRIVVGNNCMIASNTTLVDVGHEIAKDQLIKEQPIISNEILVEDDVWIGARCTILMGVTIGKGSVVAAGSVVNKSIPPYQIWAGVPAKFIKHRQ